MRCDPDDAFCFYCQIQYVTEKGLHNHIRAKHQGTYAWYNVLPENAHQRIPMPGQRKSHAHR